MGKKSVEISNLDNKNLIDVLNAALSEEWLAYYQYWVGARVMVGPMRSEVEPELLKHANEELKHAEMLVERILQLNGTPVLSPQEWAEHAKCAYATPDDPYIEKILDQNLKGERCAIERYQHLAALTVGKDYSTYRMAVNILDDELEHEDDIESWLNDIEALKEHVRKA